MPVPDIRIALVEDSRPDAILTTEFFTDLGHGYDVYVHHFERVPPVTIFAEFDGVIVDYELRGSDLNGLELCNLITSSYPKLPLVLFTGYPEDVIHVGSGVLLLSKHEDVDTAYKVRRWYAGIRALQETLRGDSSIQRLGRLFLRDRRGSGTDTGKRRRQDDKV